MAGDETKRSEARTGPEDESGATEESVPPREESIAGAPDPEGSGRAEPTTGQAENGETETPPAAAGGAPSGPDAQPAARDEDAPPVDETIAAVPTEDFPAAPSPRAEARPRPAILPRLLPYLLVFALGALISIGAAFVIYLFGGPAEQPRGELEQRFSGLDERAATLEIKQDRGQATVTGLADRLAAAEAQARQAVAAVHELQQMLASQPSPRNGEAVGAPVDLGPLASRIEALEQKLEEGKTPPDGGAAAEIARNQAIAIVAGRLVKEMERGETFGHELTALRALGLGDAELAALQPFATTGVPTMRSLADEFGKVAPAILATERKGSEDNLVERLKGYASNLVRVERLGDLSGEDLHSLVARIKFALAHDHAADAYVTWTALPETAKAVSESFGTAAKNRLDAVDAARAIESSAVAALGKPKS